MGIMSDCRKGSGMASVKGKRLGVVREKSVDKWELKSEQMAAEWEYVKERMAAHLA
jgi:hypothetical protein